MYSTPGTDLERRVTRSMSQNDAPQAQPQPDSEAESEGTHTWSHPSGASALPRSRTATSTSQDIRNAVLQQIKNGSEVGREGSKTPVPSNDANIRENLDPRRVICETPPNGKRATNEERRKLLATIEFQRSVMEHARHASELARTQLQLVNLNDSAGENEPGTVMPPRPVIRHSLHVEQWVHRQSGPIGGTSETPLDTAVPRGERGTRPDDVIARCNRVQHHLQNNLNIDNNRSYFTRPNNNLERESRRFPDTQPNSRTPRRPPRDRSPPVERPEPSSAGLSDMDKLEYIAQTMAKAIQGNRSRDDRNIAQSKFLFELPRFDGDLSEWVGFNAVYRDTEEHFSGIQNVARLRKALYGAAREAVRALIHTARDPERILNILEARFGRPEQIVLEELDKLKRMPRLADDGHNICEFAGRVCNTVAVICSVDEERFLNSPELIKQIEEKLSVVIRFDWYTHLNMHNLRPDLQIMAEFLDHQAIKYGGMYKSRAYDKPKRHDTTRDRPKPQPHTHAPRQPVQFASRYERESSPSDNDSEDEFYTPRRTVMAAKAYKHAPTYSDSEDEHRPAHARVPPRNPRNPRESDGNSSDTDSEYERFRVFSAVGIKGKCGMCKKDHYLKDCDLFKKKNTAERWEAARESRTCFRCLSGTHRRDSCRAKACGKNNCKKQHHKLLHYEDSERPSATNSNETPRATPPKPAPRTVPSEARIRQGQVTSVNTLSHERHAYLKIIPVELYGPRGKVETYALLDEGSTMTLIEQETALAIAPPGKAEELRIEGVGGKTIDEHDSYKLKVKIKGLFTRELENMHAQTISKLNLPPQEVARELVSQCEHLADVRDEVTYSCAKPTLLIGQDNWHLIVSRELKTGASSQPVASLTRLGWVLHGFTSKQIKPVAFVNYVAPASKSDSIDDLIKDHFSLESLGIQPKRPQNDLELQALKIQESTRPTEWRWVPTKYNVADDATRNVPNAFNASHRWYKGPEFLMLAPTFWPIEDKLGTVGTSPLATIEEEKAMCRTHTVQHRAPTYLPEATRFSSWTKLLRTAARVLQATRKFKALLNRNNNNLALMTKKLVRKPKKATDERPVKPQIKMAHSTLEHEHIQRAEQLLVKQIQRECFSTEINRLKKGEPIERTSRLKNICLKIDDDGILRIDGRIEAASNVQDTYKRPAVLDANHYITRLLIHHIHCEFNHGNHETVMNEIRQKYYVIALRRTVRKLVHSCQWCQVYRKQPQMAPHGNLPKERLARNQPAFTCSAVDYFGPMTVTIGRRHEKRWGALFTCLTTRAVHLELAASLTTSSMIMALRRFIARRGKPAVLYSDNGTNFVGANRELAAIWNECNEGLKRDVENRQIQWKFIPPGAPNMGGSWERLVKSIKVALDVTLKERSPREEVLHTLLLEAEHTVNSRPLTPVSLETDEEALTPNHFLIGRSCGNTSFGSFTDHDLGNESTWRASQRLADHFWARWTREYLPTLIPRQNNKSQRYQNPAPGDIVLIVDSTMPRNVWPRGEVVTVLPGHDGRVRVVEVRTTAGIVRRPASRLVIISNTDSSPRIDECSAPGGDCRRTFAVE